MNTVTKERNKNVSRKYFAFGIYWCNELRYMYPWLICFTVPRELGTWRCDSWLIIKCIAGKYSAMNKRSRASERGLIGILIAVLDETFSALGVFAPDLKRHQGRLGRQPFSPRPDRAFKHNGAPFARSPFPVSRSGCSKALSTRSNTRIPRTHARTRGAQVAAHRPSERKNPRK